MKLLAMIFRYGYCGHVLSFSEITMLELSMSDDTIFVGLWEHGLAYDPGRLIIMDDLGEVISNIKTLQILFISNFRT